LEGLPDRDSEAKIGEVNRMMFQCFWWAYKRYFFPFSWFRPLYVIFGGYIYVALAWAATIFALVAAEIGNLVWLAGGHHPKGGDWDWLAILSVISVASGMLLLLTVPTVRLFWFRLMSDELRTGGPAQDLQLLVARKLGLVFVDPDVEEAAVSAQQVSGSADAPARQALRLEGNGGSPQKAQPVPPGDELPRSEG
jgi:hypothetical protein